MIKIAIISPNKSVPSETFIKVHKEMLDGEVHYLYGAFFPHFSEKEGKLRKRRDVIYMLMNKAIEKFGITFRFDESGFKRYLRKNSIDIVLGEFGPVGAEVYSLCESAGIPLITYFRGFDAHYRPLIEEYADKYKKMFSYASFLVAVSKDIMKQLVKFGANEKKIVYNPSGANKAFLDIRPDYNSDHCFFVGRFADTKAPYNVLLAFKEAFNKNDKLRLTMAGDGSLREACMNISEYLGLSDVVSFPGAVNPDQVKNYMKESFCYVQHSITTMTGDSEGTPVGITEASAAGLPVVATRHAGIKDIIKEEETGLLVDEKDVSGMAEAIIRLANDRGLCRKLGEKGREFIASSFTAQQRVEVLNELIKKAVGDKFSVQRRMP